MRKIIIKLLPLPVKYFIQFFYYSIKDALNSIFKRDDKLLPPQRKSFFIGQCDFQKTGNEFLQYFIAYGKLKPTDKVLDVGCGIGRLALPLLSYLTDGCYYGLDSVKTGIDWCTENISSRYKNFHFIHTDILNKFYNRKGKIYAEQFKFPFEDNTFDFIFLVSLFTHLLPVAVENYLSEIMRVLNYKGSCFITYFLLNEESTDLIKSSKSQFNFKYNFNGYKTINRKIHEAAVAYPEDDILNLYKKYNLTVLEPIYYGYWCGRKNFIGLQDIIIAQKK